MAAVNNDSTASHITYSDLNTAGKIMYVAINVVLYATPFAAGWILRGSSNRKKEETK